MLVLPNLPSPSLERTSELESRYMYGCSTEDTVCDDHAVGEREPERAGEASEAVRDTERRPTTTYRRVEQ